MKFFLIAIILFIGYVLFRIWERKEQWKAKYLKLKYKHYCTSKDVQKDKVFPKFKKYESDDGDVLYKCDVCGQIWK